MVVHQIDYIVVGLSDDSALTTVKLLTINLSQIFLGRLQIENVQLDEVIGFYKIVQMSYNPLISDDVNGAETTFSWYHWEIPKTLLICIAQLKGTELLRINAKL